MKRFEVWWVRLDPTTGFEMRKTRPCVVVSRDAMNARPRTVLVAPLTRDGFEAPFRVACRLAGEEGQKLPISFNRIGLSVRQGGCVREVFSHGFHFFHLDARFHW